MLLKYSHYHGQERVFHQNMYWILLQNTWINSVCDLYYVLLYVAIKKFSLFADELEPPQILGPMSSTNQENYTVSLGGQTTLQCAVRSLGPTQIQWLKQLHDHQAPTDRNRTIVVFDFIFEVRML